MTIPSNFINLTDLPDSDYDAELSIAVESSDISEPTKKLLLSKIASSLQANNLHARREAIEWSAGLNVTSSLQLYVRDGVEYLPKASEIPFVTGSDFETGKFELTFAFQILRNIGDVRGWGLSDGSDPSVDDAPSIRAAVAHMHANGGGKVILPKPVNFYALRSYETTSTGLEACIVVPEPASIWADPIEISGYAPLTNLRVQTDKKVHSAIYLEGQSLYAQFHNLAVWGNTDIDKPLVDYVFFGADKYHPNMIMSGCQFYVASKTCLRLATYTTTMTNIQTAYSPRGFEIGGPNLELDVTTSLTMNSCYALNHTEYGHYFGLLHYSTLNSSAADHIRDGAGGAYPYRIGIARGVTMNACGAESSDRILKVGAIQGLTVNSISTLSVGNNTTPPDTLIDIEGGNNMTISGVHLQGSASYRKILTLGKTFSSESITVLDNSLKASDCEWVPNYSFDRPIRFVISDQTTQNVVYSITNQDQLIAYLNDYSFKQVVHNITFQLPDHDINITKPINAFTSRTQGDGSITFKGSANSRLVMIGDGKLTFGESPESLNVIIEDCQLVMGVITSPQGIVFSSKNITLKNSPVLSHNGYVQFAISGNVTFNNSPVTTANIALGDYKVTLNPTDTKPISNLPLRSYAPKVTPTTSGTGWIKGATEWIEI